MSNLGVFASRFSINSKTLEEFDESLRFIRGKHEITKTPEIEERINRLLDVINPISEKIEGKLSKSIVVSELDIVDIIKERHSIEWPGYRKGILRLRFKLNSGKFQLSETDFQLLNDIADALDAECENLFRRMRER